MKRLTALSRLHRARGRASRSRCATSRSAAPATCSATSSPATSPRSGFELYMQMLDEAVQAGGAAERGRRRGARARAPRRHRRRLRARRLHPLRAGQDRRPPPDRRRRARWPSSALLRDELEDRFGPVPEPLQNLLALQQARIKLGEAGARTVTLPQGRLAVTPIELDCSAQAKAFRAEIPESLYEPGRSQLSMRVPEEAAAALPGGRARRGRAAFGAARGRMNRSHVRFRTVPLSIRDPRAPVLPACSLRSWRFVSPSACCRPAAARQHSGQLGREDRRRTTITKAEFHHWLQHRDQEQTSAATGQAAGAGAGPAELHELRRAREEDRRRSRRRASRADRRAVQDAVQAAVQGRCDDQVMQFLISADWIDGEAQGPGRQGHRRRGQARPVRAAKKQSFPKEADFQKFLKPPARRSTTCCFRVQLRGALEQDRDEGHQGHRQGHRRADPAYYNKNKRASPSPSSRDLQIVLTKTRRRPTRPRRRSTAGRASRRSPRSTRSTRPPRTRAASCPASPRASRRRRSTTAVFAAKKGKLVGPVKTQFGYYVFKVTKITPATQQTLKQAKATIKQLLSRRTSRRRSTPSSRTSGRSGRARPTAAAAT